MWMWQRMLKVLFVITILSSSLVSGQSITITSLPESLFGANGGVHNVVEGSVIQLYCSVEPATATVLWMLDNITMVIDVPHLRVRTSSNGTHNNSVLTVDNFRSGDNGVYQCHAENGSNTESGITVTLTAFSSTATGALRLSAQPTDSETTEISGVNVPNLRDNRTAVSLGETETLTCTAEHVNDITTGFGMPCPAWIKDGATLTSGGDITITPQSTCMGSSGQITSNLSISNFQESDVGVYQCVFTDDSGSDGEIITSIPLRLDTGETLTLTRVSSQAVVLCPPEKLVLEVKATGRYGYIQWTRNGVVFSPTQTDPFFVRVPNDFPTSSELINFFETYVREPTTVTDLGVYEVQLISIDMAAAQSQINNDRVEIAVIPPVNVSSATTSGPTATVLEGNSVNISCSFTGIPTPTVSWSLNGNSTPFDQTDTMKDFSATIVREMNDDFQAVLVLGEITSDLNIVSATYPDHDGVYTCVGVNSKDAVFTSSSASIMVVVQVPPEVEVTSDFPNNRINIGGTITFTCSVTRGNPAGYRYRWTHLSTTIATSLAESSNVLTLSVTSAGMLRTYECEVTNDAGSGTSTITIVEGVPPSVAAVQPADPVVVDTTVELVCVVTGDSPLTITWSRASGGVVFTGNETTGGNFTLTVNSDDYGTYTCAANNALGSDNDTITISQPIAMRQRKVIILLSVLIPVGVLVLIITSVLCVYVSATKYCKKHREQNVFRSKQLEDGSEYNLDSTNHPNIPPPLSLDEAFKVSLPLASEWQNIGTLLHLPHGELEEIKADNFNQSRNCLRETLNRWLKQTNPPPSWDSLASAVETFDASKAQEIREKYCADTSA